uniref:Helicase C-terminal domain-containing protein n=1 Tax=Amphimedon queenslandica TaxID=400682 RepID=A0A1X7UD79_AMPQE
MGIDCPDVYRIIHWAPRTDIESYIQETGKADSIASYCKNTNLCTREVLFKDFEYLFEERPVGPLCCDICAFT